MTTGDGAGSTPPLRPAWFTASVSGGVNPFPLRCHFWNEYPSPRPASANSRNYRQELPAKSSAALPVKKGHPVGFSWSQVAAPSFRNNFGLPQFFRCRVAQVYRVRRIQGARNNRNTKGVLPCPVLFGGFVQPVRNTVCVLRVLRPDRKKVCVRAVCPPFRFCL